MSTPPPRGRWDEPCENVSDHQALFGQFTHCSQCDAVNPNPPARPTFTRFSSLAPRPEPESSKNNTNSSSWQQQKAQQFGMMPSHAEAQRRLGFKNRQPPRVNAGSQALSYRPAPSLSPATPKTTRLFAVKGQLYLSEVEENKRDLHVLSRPISKRYTLEQFGESWFNQFKESDWQNRVPETLSFIDWMINQSGTCRPLDITLMRGYLDYYLCTQVDIEKKSAIRVGAAIDQRQTLEEKLSCFPSLPSLTAKSKQKGQEKKESTETKEVFIVIEVERAQAQRIEAPRVTQLQSKRPMFQRPDDEGADHASPATDEEDIFIKQEHASWQTKEVRVDQPPEIIDLSTPSSRNRPNTTLKDVGRASPLHGVVRTTERSGSRSPRSTEVVHKNNKSTQGNGKKSPAKRGVKRQRVEKRHLDSADHGYSTRHATARATEDATE